VAGVKGKSILVTGASRGLGRAIALELLRQGAAVVGTGRDPAAMAETQRQFAAVSGAFTLVSLDCRDEQAVIACIARMPALHVVVNNAGISRYRPFLDTPVEEVREILEINVIGAFIVMREAARRMAREGGGLIINIASELALHGSPRLAPYCASKHALLGLGRAVRQELIDCRVRVTTFCPGPINTEIHGTPQPNPLYMESPDLAATVVHLAGTPEEIDIEELLVRPSGL